MAVSLGRKARSSATAEGPRDALIAISCYVLQGMGIKRFKTMKLGDLGLLGVIQGHWK